MKKFLLTVTLVGVVISQIFFSSVTEAYDEGDELTVKFYRCVSHRPWAGCGKIFRLIKNTHTGEVLLDERTDQVRETHVLESIGYKLYRYSNGQWVEIHSYFY